MSRKIFTKDNYIAKIERSTIIPERFKETYREDHKELSEELEESKESLKGRIATLSISQITYLKSYFSIVS